MTRWLGGGLFLLLAAACGGGSGPAAAGGTSSPSPSASGAALTTPSPRATLAVAESRYGKIIVDVSGRALYLFDADRGAASCYDACASAWPPLLAVQAPGAGPSLDQALISTTARKDGSKQVAYNGHPLYYYAGDRNPGEIKCQAAVEYGGGWYVVDGRGDKITAP